VSLARERIASLASGADPFFNMQRHQLVSLAEKNRVPTMFFFREFVTAGGLISYGSRLADGYGQVGINTGKTLKVRSRPIYQSLSNPKESSWSSFAVEVNRSQTKQIAPYPEGRLGVDSGPSPGPARAIAERCHQCPDYR
jgi:hypothetical protein